jgi:release factor glutamine methyltransferase
VPSLRSVVASATECLSLGPHPGHARQDAETLLLHILRENKSWLMAHPEKELPAADAARYSAFIARRQLGEPIQYITGETEFYGLPLLVTPHVLIPRPETEHLVEKVIDLGPIFPRPRLVDVGTGSGAIAIAFAHDWSNAAITAIDLSASALALARRNAERIGFADCIRFLQGDLLAPVANEKFEIVVSNPPYVPEPDRPTLSVEVRDHEPSMALFAGPDGLDIYRRLIPQAFACLVPGGFIALEIGYGQSPAIANLLTASGFQKIEFLPDLQGVPRVASAQHP